jgi:two-component system OmpR family response regulator
LKKGIPVPTPRVVAVVEDEAAIRENYADALIRRGYRVQAFAGRKEAMASFAGRLPDLVVIDINLGHEVDGGFELCRELRARSASLPIIFLTARDSELDAVSGLRLGADDYLTKNISLDHLLARVAALFRRVDALQSKPGHDEIIERGDLILDSARLTARYKGTSVPLTVTEFWVVHSLAEHPGHVRNRDQLMAAASTVLDDSSVTSQIKRIRAKFQTIDAGFAAIEAVYGMGYRWVES